MQPKHYFLPAFIISAVFILPVIWLSGLKDNMILAFISADIVSTDTTSTTYTAPTTTVPTTTLPTNTTTYTAPTTTTVPTTTTYPTTTLPSTNTTVTPTTTTTTTFPTTYTVPTTTTYPTTTVPTTTSTTTTVPTTTVPTTTLPTNTTIYAVPTTTSTTTTVPTTTTYPTTTLPTTDTTVAPTTTATTPPTTDTTATVPTTKLPTNTTTYTAPITTNTTTNVPKTTTYTTTTLPIADNTNMIRATDAEQTLQIEFTNLISAPITQNQRICAKTNQAVEKVVYKITGIQTQYLTVIKVSESEYCSYVNTSNFASGNYKLSAIAIQGPQTAHREIDLQIDKPETTSTPEVKISATPIINTKCQEIGITNEEECRKALLERYSPTTICQNLDQTACRNSMTTTGNMERVILVQEQYERIRVQETEIVNKSLTVEQIEQKINEEKVRDIILPVKEKTVQLTTLRATEEIKLENEQLIQTAPIVIIIDSDGDGLSNDMEKRLLTDPNKADTDGDGYNDREEIANGYNPLGEGKTETQTSPIEKAIISNKEIEHPKSSGQQKENFVVEKVENAAFDKGYILSGKCEPNSIATLYIYSDVPIVTTVATDEYGNWQYEFKESLEDGEHEVFVAINDDTGKVISKSNPLSFIVQEAKAVSATDITDIKKPLQTEEKKSDDMMIYYVTFAGIIIILGILAFIFLILNKKKIKE